MMSPGFGFGPGKSLSTAAKFLGLTDAELRTQLRDGKSLADIAKDKGKTAADLKAAMKSAITAELDQAVKDNKLTADQRTRILDQHRHAARQPDQRHAAQGRAGAPALPLAVVRTAAPRPRIARLLSGPREPRARSTAPRRA